MTQPINNITNDINNISSRNITDPSTQNAGDSAIIPMESIADILTRTMAAAHEQGINATNRTARQSDSAIIRATRKANKSALFAVVIGGLLTLIAAGIGASAANIIRAQATEASTEAIETIKRSIISETPEIGTTGAIKTSYLAPANATSSSPSATHWGRATGFTTTAAAWANAKRLNSLWTPVRNETRASNAATTPLTTSPTTHKHSTCLTTDFQPTHA